MILTSKLEEHQRKAMEAVLMEEHHTHVAIQMREMSTGEIGRIIGRLMVIGRLTVMHVHAGRRNILCLRIYMQIAFLRSRSGQLLRNEVQDGSSGQSNH
jgi:hypothetical protein